MTSTLAAAIKQEDRPSATLPTPQCRRQGAGDVRLSAGHLSRVLTCMGRKECLPQLPVRLNCGTYKQETHCQTVYEEK